MSDWSPIASRGAEFPWTEVMARLRQIWLESEDARTSIGLAEVLETTQTTLSAWCSRSRSRRQPPEWAVARLLDLTQSRLVFEPARILIEPLESLEPTEPIE